MKGGRGRLLLPDGVIENWSLRICHLSFCRGAGRRLGLDEFAVTGDFGEETADGANDKEGGDATKDNGEDGVCQCAEEAGLRAAEFVGGADEKIVDGGNATAHGVGGEELDGGVADNNAEAVGHSAQDEHCHGEPVAAGKSKANGRQTEDGDGADHDAAGLLEGRKVGDDEGAGDGADWQGGFQ